MFPHATVCADLTVVEVHRGDLVFSVFKKKKLARRLDLNGGYCHSRDIREALIKYIRKLLVYCSTVVNENN